MASVSRNGSTRGRYALEGSKLDVRALPGFSLVASAGALLSVKSIIGKTSELGFVGAQRVAHCAGKSEHGSMREAVVESFKSTGRSISITPSWRPEIARRSIYAGGAMVAMCTDTLRVGFARTQSAEFETHAL